MISVCYEIELPDAHWFLEITQEISWLYFIPTLLFFFEIEFFCSSLDGGICILSRHEYFQKRLIFTVPRHVCGGRGRVPKFMVDSLDPHNKKGSYICCCNYQMFGNLDDRGDCPANTVLQFRSSHNILKEAGRKIIFPAT